MRNPARAKDKQPSTQLLMLELTDSKAAIGRIIIKIVFLYFSYYGNAMLITRNPVLLNSTFVPTLISDSEHRCASPRSLCFSSRTGTPLFLLFYFFMPLSKIK